MNEKIMNPESKIISTTYGNSLKSTLRNAQTTMVTGAVLITISVTNAINGAVAQVNPLLLVAVPLALGIDVAVVGVKKFSAFLKTHNAFEKLKRE